MDAAEATNVVHDLQNQAVHHKSEIRKHKRQLHFTMTELARFEQQCRESGIKIILKRQGEEEGDLHGRHSNTP